MDVEAGSLVKSIAGRDKGEMFVVLKREEDFLFLANGKARKTENPKKKKLKHISFINLELEALKKKLMEGDMPTNAEIRKGLKDFSLEKMDES